MRSLPAKAKQHLFWGVAGIALGIVAVTQGWDWPAMAVTFGFGAVFIGLGIWTIQSDRRIEDLKKQAKDLDLE